MMKIALLLAFHFMCSSIHAQDMSDITSDSDNLDPILKRVLEEDKTDEHEYRAGKFVCYHFAQTFYLQRSSLVKDLTSYDLPGIESEWGVTIQRLEETEKLPFYTVTLSNKENSFYHMINALLVNPEFPEKMSSYIFIEPQTDAVMLTGEDVYKKYSRFYDKTDDHEPVKMDIGLFEAYKFNGNIYQSRGKQLYSFDL